MFTVSSSCRQHRPPMSEASQTAAAASSLFLPLHKPRHKERKRQLHLRRHQRSPRDQKNAMFTQPTSQPVCSNSDHLQKRLNHQFRSRTGSSTDQSGLLYTLHQMCKSSGQMIKDYCNGDNFPILPSRRYFEVAATKGEERSVGGFGGM